MMRFSSQRIGVLQGSELLFSDFADDGPMWTGSGQRERRLPVVFTPAFMDTPAVTVGISMWDLDRETNIRAEIAAENVTREGFDIVFRTWGDTRVARIRADWMAIGPAPDPEFWDLDQT